MKFADQVEEAERAFALEELERERAYRERLLDEQAECQALIVVRCPELHSWLPLPTLVELVLRRLP